MLGGVGRSSALLVSSRLEFELPGSVDAADATCCDKVASSFESSRGRQLKRGRCRWNKVVEGEHDTVNTMISSWWSSADARHLAWKRRRWRKKKKERGKNEKKRAWKQINGSTCRNKNLLPATWVKRRCKGVGGSLTIVFGIVGGIIRMLEKRYLRPWRSRMPNEAPRRGRKKRRTRVCPQEGRGKRCHDGAPSACGHALESDCVPEGKNKKKKKKKKKGRKGRGEKKEASGRTAASETKTEKRAVGRKGDENGTNRWSGKRTFPPGLVQPRLDFNSCYYWNTWPPRATDGRLLFLSCPVSAHSESSARENRDARAAGMRLLAWGIYLRPPGCCSSRMNCLACYSSYLASYQVSPGSFISRAV